MYRSFAGVVLVVGVLFTSACGKSGGKSGDENMGLWSGVCPAKDDKLISDVGVCLQTAAGKRGLTNCGRDAVGKRVGDSEYDKKTVEYAKVGDRLNDCSLCETLAANGAYKKSASECVSTGWLKSDEFKQLARSFGH